MTPAAQLPSWPVYAPDEIAVAVTILERGAVNYWTGEEGRLFEDEFAAACGCTHGVALTNGSVALEAALRAVGVGPGDEVIVTPRSFVASASSVALLGARPIFADVDPDSQNITADSVAPVISPRTRAIIAVHLAGWACEMDDIGALAAAHNIAVVEDCAQAHGATYRGRPVGSLGTCAAWSFCQDKIISTGGEGGMFTTSDPVLWERVWSYKDHGRSHDAVSAPAHAPGFRWYVESFGTNWRMTEMQAAIGRTQLEKLDDWAATRRRNAAILSERLEDTPALRIPAPPAEVQHAYYRLYSFVVPDALRTGWDRDRILIELGEKGVPVSVGVCPEIYRERAFADAGFAPPEPLPVAARLGRTALAFVVHPTLEARHMEWMADQISKVMTAATR
jgi:dTDP-4-amino-4,6-dideoxygalactose transaminase